MMHRHTRVQTPAGTAAGTHSLGRWALPLAISALAAGLAGCSEEQPPTSGRSFMDPVAFEERLLFVDRTHGEAHILHVGRRTLASETTRVELPAGPTHVVRRNGDHNQVLILSEGVLGSSESTSEPGALSVLNGNGRLKTFEFGSPFDTLTQSDDGRYVVLLRTGSTDRLLGNNSQIAVIDLEADDDDAVTTKDLKNLGATPRQVIFSPAMEIAGETRRIAVILADRDLALLDLSHPDREETAVSLSSDLNRNLTPRQVLFDPTEARLFVLASGSNDIFVVRLYGPIDNPGGNDFRPNLDLLGAGRRPEHMTLYQQDGQVLLLVAAPGSSEAVIVDVDSSRSTAVPVPFSPRRSLVFRLETGDEDEAPPPVALMWSPSESNRLLFIDLDKIEARGDRNVEVSSNLMGSVGEVLSLPEEDRLVVTHPDGEGLSLLDLETRTVTPLSSNQSLSSAVFDIEERRVWVAPGGQKSIAYLDLNTGAAEQVLLDAAVEHFLPVFAADRVAIVHPSGAGYVTVVDADNPTRETAQSVHGFFHADLIDQEAGD